MATADDYDRLGVQAPIARNPPPFVPYQQPTQQKPLYVPVGPGTPVGSPPPAPAGARLPIPATMTPFQRRFPIMGGIARGVGGAIQNMDPNRRQRLGNALQQAGSATLMNSTHPGWRAIGAGLGTFNQAMQPPPPGEPFTLAPGAVRYDAAGNPIAENPSATSAGVQPSPEEVEAIAAGVRELYGPAGEQLAAAVEAGNADARKTAVALFGGTLEPEGGAAPEVYRTVPYSSLPAEQRAAYDPEGLIPPNVLAELDDNGDIINIRGIRNTNIDDPTSLDPAWITRINENYTRSNSLRNQEEELKQFRNLARNTNTGWWESLTLPVFRMLHSLGVLPPEAQNQLASAETLVALQNQQALRLRNPDSGFGLTGNTSNKDIAFLTNAVAGLDRTEHANEMILTYMLAKQRRDRQIIDEENDFLMRNGGLIAEDGTTWAQHRDQWIEENAFFTEGEFQRFAEMRGVTVQEQRAEYNGLSIDEMRRIPGTDDFVFGQPDGTYVDQHGNVHINADGTPGPAFVVAPNGNGGN